MKKFFFIYILFITISIINISCENQSQPEYDPSNLKGFILDASTSKGVENVAINLPDLSLITYTNNNGYFQFLNIQMPRDPMGTPISAVKYGYLQIDNYVILRSDDTTKISFQMSRQ